MSYRTDLSASFVRSILDYDPKTGEFQWRYRHDRAVNWNSRWVGTKAGQISNGYVCIAIDGSAGYYAHRLAWLVTYGRWPTEQIDHINGNRSDNRLANLRQANNAENGHNRGPQRNNKSSGLRGVYWHGQNHNWVARIKIRGTQYSIGSFPTKEEAADARNIFARRMLGAFATTAESTVTKYRRKRRQ